MRISKELAGGAQGFERYAFGPRFILKSSSWRDAAEKIAAFLVRRESYDSDAVESYYSEGADVLWREYQLLFMCQLLEFRLASFIGDLHRRKRLRKKYVAGLMKHRRANAERAKKPERLVSPRSLLVDIGLPLGELVKVVREQTLRFHKRAELLRKLDRFTNFRNAFIHHSFSSPAKIPYVVSKIPTAALKCGNDAIVLMDKIGYRVSDTRIAITA